MTDDVASQEWAQYAKALPADAQAQLVNGANALLQQPEALCSALETELYILRDVLNGAETTPTP